jgi:hypothetical protein
MNRAERVLKFLEERPDVWIEAIRFEPIGGRQAWRTAISECRALAQAKGWDILNRQRRMHQDGRWTCSEYMLSAVKGQHVLTELERDTWGSLFGGERREGTSR